MKVDAQTSEQSMFTERMVLNKKQPEWHKYIKY